jgi:hypothetical protein
MMGEEKHIINEYLASFKVKHIDELPKTVLIGLLGEFTEPLYGGALRIYEESNEDERKTLIKHVRECIEGNASISYYLVSNEGVKSTDNDDYFDFCSRHSVWYEVASI